MQVPAPFEYQRASSVAEAVAMLEHHGEEARLIAGGHSLLPMMKLRLAAPEVLIDINEVTDLQRISVDGDTLRIGAMTRHAELLASAVVGEHYRMLHDAERVIADPVVRNRGTIGGSLCQADPSEDLSAAFGALRAEVVIVGSAGERVVPVRALVTGPYETVVGPARSSRRSGSPCVPGPAALPEGGAPSGRLADRVGRRGGLARRRHDRRRRHRARGRRRGPLRWCPARRTPSAADPPTRRRSPSRRRLAGEECHPRTDQRGPADYKRHLAGELTRRALRTALARAADRRPDDDAGDDDRQRGRGQPRRRAAAAARALPARPPPPDRHPLGLRHLELRGLRRLDGRRAGQELHRARGHGLRARGAHGRGPGAGRRARPGAAGFHERARAAVRLLHAGDDDDRPLPARHHRRPHRGRDPRGHLGQLCRCTGYENIVRSIRWAAEHPRETATEGASA